MSTTLFDGGRLMYLDKKNAFCIPGKAFESKVKVTYLHSDYIYMAYKANIS